MSFDFDGQILLAGAGKMGAAMLAGWLARGIAPSRIVIQDPNLEGDAAALVRKHGVDCRSVLHDLQTPPAVMILAVKPQAIDQVFPPLAKLAGLQTVVLSIAAGKSIASFEQHLAPRRAVVRAMPNTPAAIGRGISGAVANEFVSPLQKTYCDQLLGAIGEVVWLHDESLIDAVTAVSGSGPAYVFLLTECLAEAGRAAGLAPDLALKLARATVSGSGELMRQSALDPATLRQNVTSPGGTTAAALNILMRDPDGLGSLMHDAVQAALMRGKELGK